MAKWKRATVRWMFGIAAFVLVLLVLAASARHGGRAAQALQMDLTPVASATPTPTIPINQATPIACGQAIAGSTAGGVNNVSVYGCAPWWPMTGPERVFALSLGAATDVDALLSGLSADLDLFVLTGPNPASCIAFGDNAVSLRGLAAGTYYVVVDGFDGAAGPFQLNVWCPLAITPTPTPTITPTATPRPTLSRYYLPLLLHSVGNP